MHAPIFAVKKKAKSITYSKCVFVDLGIQHAMPFSYVAYLASQ